MHFFAVAAALVSIASLAATAPTCTKEKRDDEVTEGKVKICTGSDSSGDCSNDSYTFNECHQIPERFFGSVLTFIPDHKVLCRVTHSQNTCTPHGDLFIEWPGSVQFGDYNGEDYSDITSFLCQECTKCP